VLSIRPATAEDAGPLATMIRELAEFERELDSVSITEADLVRDGFGVMRWEVLNWNKSAIELYKSLGATFLDDWRLVLLPSEGVQRLAEKAA